MISTKEKANELLDKMLYVDFDDNDVFIHFKHAQRCALIAVEEIKDALALYGDPRYEIQNMESEFRFWDNVEEEIKKL